MRPWVAADLRSMEGEGVANTKIEKCVLAELLQTPKWEKAPLQKFCKGQNGEKRPCRSPANTKMRKSVLAGVLQTPKWGKALLQKRCKAQKLLRSVCGSPASLSRNFLAFAGAPQVSRKTFWRLRDSRKHLQSRGPSGRRTEMRFRAFHTEIKRLYLCQRF